MMEVQNINDELKKRARESFLEAFNSLVVEDEDEVQSATDLIRRAWENADPCLCELIAEIIEHAVELTIDRVLIWAHIVESQDAEQFYPDGWYAFIAVDPNTRKCVTFHDDYCGKTILARLRVQEGEQEAVEAVAKLSCLILQNLGEWQD